MLPDLTIQDESQSSDEGPVDITDLGSYPSSEYSDNDNDDHSTIAKVVRMKLSLPTNCY